MRHNWFFFLLLSLLYLHKKPNLCHTNAGHLAWMQSVGYRSAQATLAQHLPRDDTWYGCTVERPKTHTNCTGNNKDRIVIFYLNSHCPGRILMVNSAKVIFHLISSEYKRRRRRKKHYSWGIFQLYRPERMMSNCMCIFEHVCSVTIRRNIYTYKWCSGLIDRTPPTF